LVPTVEQVALVLVSCRQAGVAMKAAAGLEHPLRRGEDHGFLNLVCAAALADQGNADVNEVSEVLAAESANELPLADLSADDVRSCRRRLFKTIGMCSWREPIEGLRELGWLD
jgi:hypothetical protein